MKNPIFGGDGRRLRLWVIGLAAILLLENAYLAYPWLRDLVVQPQETEEARGRRLAGELGCFNCHGPGGRGGVANPGSRSGDVPSFHEGTPMMFVHDDDDIREYIRNGAPAAKRARDSYRAEIEAQAIRMPAFAEWVDEAEIDALVAYVRAASELLVPGEQSVLRGAELARANGCFACHGEMGSGGHPNPGSFKGYIPGFFGTDFEELVRGEDELRSWIAEGTVPRLRDDSFASFFLERQRIQMPAYGDHLREDEIEALMAYVRWLAGGSWRGMAIGD